MKKILITLIVLLFGLNSYSQIIPVTQEQLYNAFKQKIVQFHGTIPKLFPGGGNCASIALIKSAIGTFGINGVFKRVKYDSTNEMVYVTLQNDSVIDLSFDRLGSGESSFYITKIQDDQISQKIAQYAKFCFAVMCRAKQLSMGYDTKYFYRGVDALNKGADAAEIYKLLGLKKVVITDLSIENLKKMKNIVIFNEPHAVYCSSGYYDEERTWTVYDDCPNFTASGIESIMYFAGFHCQPNSCDGSSCQISGAYSLK